MTQEELKKLLHYDEFTGKFTWLVQRGKMTPGMPAGSIGNRGYASVNIGHRNWRSNRLAWLYMTGEMPTMYIDHINGDRSDNRWKNLRELSHSANLQNMKHARKDNHSTGILGVSRVNKRFRANIQVNGKNMHLGYHDTPEVAHAAYLTAKRQFHEGNTL